MSRSRDLLAQLMGVQAEGGQMTDGDPALGIPGFSEAPRGRTWDALTSAHAPDLPGDAVAGRFAVSPLLPEQVEVVAPGPDDGEP